AAGRRGRLQFEYRASPPLPARSGGTIERTVGAGRQSPDHIRTVAVQAGERVQHGLGPGPTRCWRRLQLENRAAPLLAPGCRAIERSILSEHKAAAGTCP